MSSFNGIEYGKVSPVEKAERDVFRENHRKRLAEKMEIERQYNRDLQSEYIQLYIDYCSFDDEYRIVDDIDLDLTKPDDYEYNYFQAIRRAKMVSGYAFQEGEIASAKGITDLPDKYKTLDELTREIYDRYNSNGIVIDETIQQEIKKEINRRFNRDENALYRKFYEAGYAHNEIEKQRALNSGNITK